MKKTIILLCIFTLACTRGEEQSITEFFIDTTKYPAEAVEIQDLIEDVYLIPLETTPECIIGSLSKLDQNKSNIFYVSRQDLTIYRFTSGGKFINKINHLGKGPGEYTRIRHMEIVPDSETILISNPGQKKMIQYRYSGELVKEIPIPSSTGQFRILNDDVIALHIGRLVASHDSTLRNDLIFMDLEGSTLSKQFPHNKPLFFEFGNTFSRPNHDGSFYYSKQFDFNLYRIKDTSMPEVKYRFNYSNKMASYDDLDGPGIEDMGALRKTGKKVLIDNLINTYTHIGLRNYTQREASLTLINKKSGDINMLGQKSQNILGNYHGLNIPFPSDSHQEYFLGTIDAIDFIEILDNLDPEQKQYLTKKVKGFESASLCKEDSNPILVYYKFK